MKKPKNIVYICIEAKKDILLQINNMSTNGSILKPLSAPEIWNSNEIDLNKIIDINKLIKKLINKHKKILDFCLNNKCKVLLFSVCYFKKDEIQPYNINLETLNLLNFYQIELILDQYGYSDN